MIRTRVLTGPAVRAVLPDVARLRIAVFRDWPYLYDGDAAYEERYLEDYATSDGAVIALATDEGRIVGAATGMPLRHHADEFAAALQGSHLTLDDTFYCAESVLLPQYRGQGVGHAFFDAREAQARSLGLTHATFCSVVREPSDPRRPADYKPLDPFWRKRGYAPVEGAVASFSWTEIGGEAETSHDLQFWAKRL
ncbi:N-acetyltransferase family protein [Pseudaestuariivita sp.]|uniref:N-acetyltransferase family protein n=1 Tax=Pseudaestuariivita sp. TaxID=2211669 RepID=UPI004059E9C5